MDFKKGDWNISDFKLGEPEDYSDLIDDKMQKNIVGNI
jgi:hypothetical protein